MLTSRDSTQDVVRGLNAGADDYLTKPFALEELLARVNALTRRQLGPATGILRYQDLEMDRLKRVVKRGGRLLDFSPREFRLLEFFLLSPERVVSRSTLLEKVWDMSFDPETNVVDAHISNLREEARGGKSAAAHSDHPGRGLRAPDRRRRLSVRSFRVTLALRTAAAVLALTLLLGVISAFALRTLLYRQLDGTLVHLAEVEAQAGAAHASSEFEFHEGVLLAASPGPSAELTRYAQLWTSDGQPLIRSRNLPADLMLPASAVPAAREGRIVWDTHLWRGERLRCVVYPLQLVGAAHGMHMLQVAAPLAPLERTLRDFILLGLLLSLLAVGAAFLVGWRVAGAALRPTAEITAQAEAIREGTPAPTITAHAVWMSSSGWSRC